jgi:hypothetical protein
LGFKQLLGSIMDASQINLGMDEVDFFLGQSFLSTASELDLIERRIRIR